MTRVIPIIFNKLVTKNLKCFQSPVSDWNIRLKRSPLADEATVIEGGRLKEVESQYNPTPYLSKRHEAHGVTFKANWSLYTREPVTSDQKQDTHSVPLFKSVLRHTFSKLPHRPTQIATEAPVSVPLQSVCSRRRL